MNVRRGRMTAAPPPKTSARGNIPNRAPSFAHTSSSTSSSTSTTTRSNATNAFSVSSRYTFQPSNTNRRLSNTNQSQTQSKANPSNASRNIKTANRTFEVRPSATKSSPPIVPEKELMKAVNAILSHTSSSISFATVFKAARNITTNSFELYDKLKMELINRLDDLDISSIQKLINEWKNFQKEIIQIQSFMKFVGLKSIQDQYNSLPHWKYKELCKQHVNKCMKMGIDLWNSEVHPRALYILHDEIQESIRNLVSNNANCDSLTRELFDLLGLLGHDCVEPIKELFRTSYESLDPHMSDTDRLFYLINETKKLSSVFPINILQPITIIPYMPKLVNGLLEKRFPEALIALKQFLLPEHISKYTTLVNDQMKSVSLPIDYFSLVGYLNFYSSVMYNDAPARTIVSNFISKADSKFPVQFVSVLFGHFDLPSNVKELAPLVPLYAESEQLSTELTRAFLLRLLQKHSTNKEKELAFAKTLNLMFSNEQMRGVYSMLRDYTAFGNFIVMNSTLSNPLVGNDQSKVPPEFEAKMMEELKSYSENYQSRKFVISGAFTIFFVKARWGKNERFITMSALQYLLIQMIQQGNYNFKSTNASLDVLNSALKFLIKSKIAKKVGDKFYICEEPPKEKKMNIFINSINVRFNERQKIIQSHDHTMSIQSVIAKLMKANRRMQETELNTKIIEELSQKFNIRDGDIPKVIDRMIEGDFIERDKSDTRFLVYVP
ncbi:hypothetical protein TRFO_29878 [Tritrichomonas foetus]|uniref:Cullin neddylation domain-containing protein n=1 Tax=Tritrichomonas foetus TaxID=1144522 RepID=A0A1J4JZH5_9EUKA|nr:hypothetical protein TRFO_29878 [Tritrichomonas foetus]|eukprot:OHT02932.1 hypothetical protein TRFO_29878 [Tritrichomonas foetus]